MLEVDGKGNKHAEAIGFRHCSMVLLITTKPHEKQFQHRLMHDSPSSDTASGAVSQVKGWDISSEVLIFDKKDGVIEHSTHLLLTNKLDIFVKYTIFF